ncbi:hypothetical protein [Sphingomonas sp.]|uniref:hypothetical protein n=1 Tax=Sphingomonas sp. TaxID=28214 RepID=UPI0031DEFE93
MTDRVDVLTAALDAEGSAAHRDKLGPSFGIVTADRAIGGKKDPASRKAAREVAARLAASDDRTARWNGKDALRAFAKADAKGHCGLIRALEGA